jgi:hypothetical protein
VRDAWAPYDTYIGVAHALCNAHLLPELIYVQDTAPDKVADLAEQATDALLKIKDLVETAAGSGTGIDVEALAHHTGLLRSAVALGKTATSGRATKLERTYNALFTPMIGRWADYLRFTSDPLVPFDNNRAEQTIRMPKLRVKVSGCLRSLGGAQDFAAIRSYIATALRGSHNMLDCPGRGRDSLDPRHHLTPHPHRHTDTPRPPHHRGAALTCPTQTNRNDLSSHRPTAPTPPSTRRTGRKTSSTARTRVDAVMQANNLTALLFANSGSAGIGAKAGYPSISIPAGTRRPTSGRSASASSDRPGPNRRSSRAATPTSRQGTCASRLRRSTQPCSRTVPDL